MSRYVDKKHGLVIGSDNVFFITHDTESPEGVAQFRDGYRATVWARRYTFSQITSITSFVETPANQIMWKQVKITALDHGLEEMREQIRFELKPFMRRWLTENVGPIHDKWDVRTYPAKTDRVVFFKQRKDALAFTTMIEQQLAGMEFL